MEKLIPTINKLQDAFTIAGLPSLELPQIAVIGSQSSGKSSVLESIVGRDFLPRGAGIVTRRPLILQCTHHDGSEYGEFLHLGDKKFYDFLEIRKEIAAETDRETGSNKGISNKPIHLKIYSPKVLNLTLIDLPGLTKVAVGDQPQDIDHMIRKMLLSFIEKESCLILAVSPANVDIANSDALQLAKQVDPSGNRTIGVMTKLDLMDEGTDILDILKNEIYPLKHGFVGVVNRSQKDINGNKDVGSSLQKEESWFQNHAVYSNIASQCGTPYLQKKLNETLISHIKQHMPSLRGVLTTKAEGLEKELESMNLLQKLIGNSLKSEVNHELKVQNTMMHVIRMFDSTFRQMIHGHDGDVLGDDLFNSDSLIAGSESKNELTGAVRIKYMFQVLFPNTLIQLENVLLSTSIDREIRTLIHNTQGLRTGLFIPDAVFEILAKRLIHKMEAPAIDCVDQACVELEKTIDSILSSSSTLLGFPLLKEWLRKQSCSIIKSFLTETKNQVRMIIKMEVNYINTAHPDFVGRSGIDQWVEKEKQKILNPKDEISDDEMEYAVMEGSLMKQGGFRKNWRKRYFILNEGELSFYEKQGDSECKGSIPLANCKVTDLASGQCYPADESEGKERKQEKSGRKQSDSTESVKPFSFEISGEDAVLFRNHSKLVLVAENEEEKKEWITCISHNISLLSSAEKPKQNEPDRPDTPESIGMPNQPRDLYDSKVNNSAFYVRKTDDLNIPIIRKLVYNYLVIVRKHVQDLVPKAVMLMIISCLKNSLNKELTQTAMFKLNDPASKSEIMSLFEENESAVVERKKKSELYELLMRAISLIDSTGL